MTEYISREEAIKACCCGCNPAMCSHDCDEVADIRSVPAADVVPARDFWDCRNELCLLCGNYKQKHLGACDDCRWRDE